MLYNDCCHGFWVHSWRPHVFGQTVTLWLVNRGMAVHQGKPVEQVCNRKETTWYENHAVSFRVQSESRVKPGICSQSEVLGHLWQYGLQGGSSTGTPLAPGRKYGARRSPLYLSFKLTTNCVPPSRIKWERYILIKKCLSFVHYLWLCSWSGLWQVYNKNDIMAYRWK